jgi:uncharacterized spore protein YtfJ
VDKGLRRLIDAVAGARLCYGEPVRHDDRTVIPVSRVRATGGWGYGRDARAKKEAEAGSGGGGGGYVKAAPAGFIEVGPDGARFHEIADPDRTGRLLTTGAAALTTVVAGLAGARRLRGARGPKGLLSR